MTLAEWSGNADDLCGDMNRELRERFGRPPTVHEELVEYVAGAHPVISRTLIDLRGLQRPDDRSAEIEEFFDLVDEQNDHARALVTAWQNGDSTGYENARARLGRASADVSTAAANPGAVECARGPFG